MDDTRPGKHRKSDMENGPVEIVDLHNYGKSPFIVDLPIKNGDFPWFSVNVYQAGYNTLVP